MLMNRVIILPNFYTTVVQNFFIAFGVVIGGSIFSGLGGLITGEPPLKSMMNIANSIKIWGVAIALGGTFSSFVIIEKGLFEGEIKSIVKQIIYIFVALLGSNIGYIFIKLIEKCGKLWEY